MITQQLKLELGLMLMSNRLLAGLDLAVQGCFGRRFKNDRLPTKVVWSHFNQVDKFYSTIYISKTLADMNFHEIISV